MQDEALVEVGSGDDRRDASAAHYWDIRDIQFHCRLSRSTAWRLVRQDGFPPPVLCVKRCLLWPRREVIEFLEERRDPGHYRPAAPAPVSRPAAPTFATRAVRQRAEPRASAR